MAKIKSAWEKVLERTEDIQIDKDKLRHAAEVDKIRRIAGAYLSDDKSEEDMESELSAVKDRAALKEALSSLLVSNLSITETVNEARLERLLDVVSVLASGSPQLVQFVQQIIAFIQQYPVQRDELLKRLEEQYRPMLEEKEAKLSKQYGQQVHLSAENDKEFMQMANKNLDRLLQQYTQTLVGAKDQLKELIDQL